MLLQEVISIISRLVDQLLSLSLHAERQLVRQIVVYEMSAGGILNLFSIFSILFYNYFQLPIILSWC